MKFVVQIKLLPTVEQSTALAATLRACNKAADLAAEVAYRSGRSRAFSLQPLVYSEIRARFRLSAQPTVQVIKKVAEAYASRATGISNAARRRPISFRPDAAQPFDDRCLSWQHEARTISIWTIAGRLKAIPYTGETRQLTMLAVHRRGESDLVMRDGKWFLLATCDMPETPLNTQPVGWIGVDRGITNLATTSSGRNFSGKGLNRYRRRQARLRAELQAKNTRSAKRVLKRRARKEARHAAHINHKISKEIVADAERTGRGIALENLSGIRCRVRPTRHQRATLSNWPFQQLGAFCAYKAQRVGVPLVEVDAAYTSQTCPRCGHVSRRNRPSRDIFTCVVCGLAGPADHIAALNVARRAGTVWAFVNMPHATE